MVTPFDDSFTTLGRQDQLLMMRGCALCRITRDVESGSTRTKDEWASCRAELGVPVEVFTRDVIPPDVGIPEGPAPAVWAVDISGEVHQLMGPSAIDRCKGSVRDFRGRLAYRIASCGLEL